jgi:hypothetical protein
MRSTAPPSGGALFLEISKLAALILSSGVVSKVDDDFLPAIVDIRWGANGLGYVTANILPGWVAYLHRIVVGARQGQFVDHINGDPLDNRRSNLRLCTHAENMRNRRRSTDNKSGFKGVYFDLERKKWRTSIRCDGRRITLGRFDKIEDAYAAYCAAAVKYHGEFARFS